MAKKPVLIFLFSVGILFSQTSLSKAAISFADTFKIVAVNGKSYNANMLNKANALSLRDGINRIAVFYQASFDTRVNHSKETVRSGVYLLTVYLQKGGHYRQRVVKPHNAAAARKFALNPLFDLVEESVEHKRSIKQSVPLKFQWQRLISRDPAALIKKTRLKKGRALNLSALNLSALWVDHQSNNVQSYNPVLANNQL